MPNELENEFAAKIEAWRAERGLRDDDPVLLCVQLFRLHQQHWDEIRRQDIPRLDDLRDDIESLTESSATLHREAAAMVEALQRGTAKGKDGISPAIAIWSAILIGIASFLLGRAFA